MVYRQKVELAYFSNACEAFGRLALHGSVQLNPPILTGLKMSRLHGLSITIGHGLRLAGFDLFQFILSPHENEFMSDLTRGGKRNSLSESMRDGHVVNSWVVKGI